LITNQDHIIKDIMNQHVIDDILKYVFNDMEQLRSQNQPENLKCKIMKQNNKE